MMEYVTQRISVTLEGIDRISRCCGAHIRFQAVTIHNIYGAIKQTGYVILESHILVHGHMRIRLNFNHDIDVAVRAIVAARTRAKQGSMSNAALPQRPFMRP